MTDTERFLMMQLVGTLKQAEQNGLGKVNADDLEHVTVTFDERLYAVKVEKVNE